MKKKTLIILSAVTLLFSLGCSDYLDVNHDPNALEKIPEAKVLLPAAELGIANNLMGWDFGFAGAFWVEYWTQSYSASQFKSLCEYQPHDFGTAYTSLMREPMADLRRIKAMTAEDENRGYFFIAEALSIFAWQIVTDVWGDMPYSEALQGDKGIMHPKQDKGKDIYADLLKRIDDLLEIDLDESHIEGKYDFIYGGDLDRWREFAFALKLKLMLRLSETPEFDRNAIHKFVSDNEDEFIYFAYYGGGAKIPGYVWDDVKPGKRHPMRAFQFGGANYFSTNVIGCRTFVDYLKTNKDPRLASLFSGDTGAFFGDFDSKEDSDGNGTLDSKEKYCTVAFPEDMDLFLMSPWETFFNMAEVYARAGDLVNAQGYYEEAVFASLEQHGILDWDIIAPGGYAEWQGGTTEACIKQIAMQRWVANCNYQHIESFLERNRTKYPSVHEIDIKANRQYADGNFPVGYLTISVNGRALLNGNLPASPLYPESYIMRNNNAPKQKTNVGEKVWWNLKQGK